MIKTLFRISIEAFLTSKLRTTAVIITVAVLLFIQTFLFQLQGLTPSLPISPKLDEGYWISTREMVITPEELSALERLTSDDATIIPIQKGSATLHLELETETLSNTINIEQILILAGILKNNPYNYNDDKYSTVEIISTPFESFDDFGVSTETINQPLPDNGVIILPEPNLQNLRYLSLRSTPHIDLDANQINVGGTYSADGYISESIYLADDQVGTTLFETSNYNHLLVLNTNQTDDMFQNQVTSLIPGATIQPATNFDDSLKNHIFPSSWVALFQIFSVFLGLIIGVLINMMLYIYTHESSNLHNLIRSFGGTRFQLLLLLFFQNVTTLLIASTILLLILHPLFLLFSTHTLEPVITISNKSYILSLGTSSIFILILGIIPIRSIVHAHARIRPTQTTL